MDNTTAPTLSEIQAFMESLRDKAVPIGSFIDLRHMMTANITQNLYGADPKEGRQVLLMRNSLDEFIYNSTAADLVGDDPNGLMHFKRGLSLENIAEQLAIIEAAISRADGSAAKLRFELEKIIDSPDYFCRFSSQHQQMIKAAAANTLMDKISDLAGASFLTNNLIQKRVDKVRRAIAAEANRWS